MPHYNPDKYFGPFNTLTMNTIKANWLFNALIPAYGNDRKALRNDLQALDDEITVSLGHGGINPDRSRIWAWTWNVRVQDIQVIIVGNQPTNQVEGSGLAFHPIGGEVSVSVRKIFNQLSEQFGLKAPNPDGNFSLDGWTRQGVVLVNAITTKGKKRGSTGHQTWLKIMDKLLSYLYDNDSQIQFILAGALPREKFLNSQYNNGGWNNRILLAHHPSYDDQDNDTRYYTFVEALQRCDAPIKWTFLKMWNYYRGN